MIRPIEVTLRGPWKGRDQDWTLAKWTGSKHPVDAQTIEALVHHHSGGQGIFRLPDLPAMLAWCRKAARRPDGIAGLNLLARVAIFSQLPLADAIWLQCWMVDLKPPSELVTVSEWRAVGVLDVDALQARWGTRLAGAREIAELRTLRDTLAAIEIDIAAAQIDAARAALTARQTCRAAS
ncbi:hypothetical protein GCM10009785_19770 [Brooklawnia cerclae]|uniref:Uncharacterized protein n=1 Tax=Brooklawnia cerclae TaxID=349934 RepID=A0ABX0SFY1_9ACTN|nr:hypothetical protein [Brooklawnia cerclae]NIH57282.1 hypothetical protein [Brooklawnia cerclae]